MDFKELFIENVSFLGTFAKTKFDNVLYYSRMTAFGGNSSLVKVKMIFQPIYNIYPSDGLHMFYYIIVFGVGTLIIKLSSQLLKIPKWMIRIFILSIFLAVILGVTFARCEWWITQGPHMGRNWCEFNWKVFLFTVGAGIFIDLLIIGSLLIYLGKEDN